MALQYHFTLPPSGPADALVVREMFDDVKAYVDTLAPISGAAPSDAEYVTLATNPGLTGERVLTGTANQIVITDNGAGSTVVLSLPQDITNTSSPTFAGIKLRNSSGNTVTINPSASIFTPYTLILPLDDGNANQFLQTNGSGVLVWASVTSGVTDIHGTPNQIIVSATTGSVTLSLPQDIDTISSPHFNELLLSGGTSAADLTLKLHDSNNGIYVDGATVFEIIVNSTIAAQWDFTTFQFWNTGPIQSGSFKFRDAAGAHPTVTIVPPTGFTSYTLTLPVDDGTPNQYLTTNGSGVLSWTNAAGTGTVNSGTANQLAYYASSTNAVSGLTAITANRALVSDTNGLPVAATTTAAEIAFVNGVTSAIQTQLNAKATDSLVVHLAGIETITGAKTLSAIVEITVASVNALKIDASNSGATEGILLNNTSNTANSDAEIVIKVGGTTAGNPFINFQIPSGGVYALGIDNSDLDKFKISYNTALGTNDYFIINPATTGISFTGSNTNDTAPTGYVGEIVLSSVSSFANAALSGQYGNITSIVLTAGRWIICGTGQFTQNGSTMTRAVLAISVNSGNSTADQISGINDVDIPTVLASSGNPGLGITYFLALSTTTTIYLKARAVYTVGTPQFLGTIQAIRHS